MIRPIRIGLQFAVLAALFAAVAWFADRPRYRQIPNGSSVIMLSLVHGADRRAQCRRLSPAEIAKLPPNMRKVQDCPRGRPPVYIELDLGERNVYRAALPPTGVAGDGPSRVYQRFVVPAGDYDIAVRMRDTPGSAGFDYEGRQHVALAPEQLFVIDFAPETKQFVFR
jgi:hypothetical protein